MERHERQLETLASISRLLAVRSGQRELLAAVLSELEHRLAVRRGTILLLTPNGRELVVAAARSVEEAECTDERYQLGEGIVGRVVQTAEPSIVPRIADEPQFMNRIHRREVHEMLDVPTNEHDNFITYCFSTDMTEENIIFGGEKRLRQAIQEAYDLFHPKAIAVFSTCPVGLIGDDVHQVTAEMKAKLGINVFGFSCEGYKGVSQSAGHHIANNQVFKHIVGEDDTPRGKWSLNLLGEYNIGGDAFLIEDLFRRCGIDLVATFSGNSTYDQFANSHMAKLNCVMCHRSINYVADMIEKKYGTPWIKVNFIGAAATAKSLRKIADYFQDDELTPERRAGDRGGDAGRAGGPEEAPAALRR